MRNWLIVLSLTVAALSACSTGPSRAGRDGTGQIAKSPSASDALSPRTIRPPSVVFLGGGTTGPHGLVSVAEDGSVVGWDVASASHQQLFQVNGRIDGAALSPKGDYLAVRRGSRVAVVSLTTKSQVASLSRLKAAVNALSFDPLGETVLLGCADGNVYRWKFASNSDDILEVERSLERYAGHPSVVSAVASHPTGQSFFSGDWQGTIVAWRVYDADEFHGEYDRNLFDPKFFAGKAMHAFRVGEGGVAIERLKVSADGQYLVVGLANGTLELWQVRGFLKLASVPAHRGMLYDLDIAPDGQQIATVGRDGFVRFWRIEKTLDPSKLASPTTFVLTRSREVAMGSVRRITVADAHAFAGGVDGSVFELS